MLLKEICTANVVCCAPQATAIDAARAMRQKHVGDVVVVDDPEKERIALGVITDRDLAIEVLGNARDPAKTAVATIMRKPVVIARESEDVSQVIERMRAQGVRRIPVVDDDDGSVVGIVTLDDLIRVLVWEMHSLIDTEAKGQRREQMARR